MTKIDRRTFTGTVTLAAAAMAAPAQAKSHKIKMYKDLGVGHLGVKANQEQAIEYAAKFGFEGVDVHLWDLMKMSKPQRKDMVDSLKAKGLHWGTSGVPVQFRKDEETFKKGMKGLPEQAKVLEEIGNDRMVTWIMPGRDDITYLENFKMHANRLREVAKVCKDHGIRLGLEFVGPQTLRNRFRFPFVHTQPEMLQLCDEIGTGNVGLLLDAFHWFTSHGTEEELKSLTNEQLVLVHVNDAIPGRGRDEQIDGERALPTTTGVIPLKSFINILQDIGYDGPVTCEPFNDELRKMDDEKALQKTSDSLDTLFGMIEV
jgi:sugar phosphate isomerase/epimerase